MLNRKKDVPAVINKGFLASKISGVTKNKNAEMPDRPKKENKKFFVFF